MPRLSRLAHAVTVACLMAAWLALAAPTNAHAELVSSSPADGAELTSSPTEIRLVFNEAPRLDSLSVRLFDRRGAEVGLGQPTPGPLSTTVIVPIAAELRPGPYTVVWFVVSSEDEHPETKEFVFGVGEPAGAPSVTAGDLSGAGANSLLPIATFLAILGLTLMIGSASQARFFGLDRSQVVGAAIIGSGASLAAVLVRAIGAPRAAATISDGTTGLLGRTDPADITRVALIALFVSSVLATRAVSGRSRARLWLAAIVLSIGLAWLQAATSHAAGVGILPWVGVAWRGIDLAISDPGVYRWFSTAFELSRQLNIAVAAIHSVAVGAWVGGLIVASLVVPVSDDLARWHPRFSRFALRAFLVVAVTGLYQAILYLPDPSALVASEYGLVLIGKHAFVAGVLAMAVINRFVAGPALRRAGDLTRATARAHLAVRSEAVIGLGVLAATGLLATTPPARPPTAIFLRSDVVAAFAERTVSIAGNRAGYELRVTPVSATRQRFELTAAGPVASPPVLRLRTTHDTETRTLPLTVDGSVWKTEGIAFTRDGPWTASVAVAVADASEVAFEVEVAFGRVMGYDQAARAVWDSAIRRSESDMRSARMIDQLTDGSSVMLFGYHEFEAPDRERFDIQGRFSSVTAAGRRYTRDAGSDRWLVQDAGQTVWPTFEFLQAAIGVRVEGEASQGGKRCQVLAGTDPQSDVTYEIWVGRDDGIIHRLVMGLPGHYMVNAYFDVNEPVDIEPPSTAVPAP